MSKISITPSASGTGVFTISSPATNTNRTLTLPDEAGTVLTSASTANFPAGSVLQVVYVQYATVVSTTSTSFVDTGLSATITPSSTSSKILVIMSQTISTVTASSNSFAQVLLLRGTTGIWIDNRLTGIGQYMHSTPSCTVLDSPSSTSALVYKSQFLSGDSSFAFEAQHNASRKSTMTLMEIAG